MSETYLLLKKLGKVDLKNRINFTFDQINILKIASLFTVCRKYNFNSRQTINDEQKYL